MADGLTGTFTTFTANGGTYTAYYDSGHLWFGVHQS